jgi:LysR family nod box-dependent transcriptional activator
MKRGLIMGMSRNSADSASRQVNFRKYDLNILPFLRALLATHSVARSSEILGVSQSAVSGALKRLRDTFGDPLFVQVGRGLVPTPKALQLQGLIEDAFGSLACLFEERQFDAFGEQRCFVICTSDYITAELAVPLVRIMRERAPQCSVRFMEMAKSELKEVERGNIDIQISPRTERTPQNDLISEPLGEDEQILLVPGDMEVSPDGLSLEQYLGLDHASFFVNGADSFEKIALDKLGLVRKTLIYVPEHGQLPRLVRDLGVVAMVPKSASQGYAQEFGLQVTKVPFEMSAYKQSIHWSPLLEHDPAHRWFRALIAEAWSSRVRTNQA